MVARRIRETLRVRGATDRAVEHRRDLRRSTKGHLMPTPEESVLDALCDALIDDHVQMLMALVRCRLRKELPIETVAERMGVSSEDVVAFEHYDANPRLDTIQRYALAVGARIVTRVES